MSKEIYNYDIVDSSIPVMKSTSTTKPTVSLGVSENSYSNNSLNIGSSFTEKAFGSINNTTTKQQNNVKLSYTTYGYTDSQIPVFSTKSQEAENQAYIDWLQNERLKYMEAVMNPTSGSSETISGKTEAEQIIIEKGGITNVVTDNTTKINDVKTLLEINGITSGSTNLDAGSW